MKQLSIYRKRFIPNDYVHLKDDIILKHEKNLLITRWDVLRPRRDMVVGGFSAYYLDLGIKVSKFLDKNNQLVRWYCDIFQVRELSTDIFIYEDLLLDVAILPDNTINILDLDELADAFERKLITPEEAAKSMRILHNLLNIIYQGNFTSLTNPLTSIISNLLPTY